jgi:hypothetical protein
VDVFAGATAPFAIALGLTLAIALIEVAGLIMGLQPSAAIDGVLPDLDVPDVEAGVVDLGPLSSLLSWLNFGRVPALVVLILLCASFGLAGFIEQDLLRRIFGTPLDPWLASVPAAIAAAFCTRYLGRAIARVAPREETDAVSTGTFLGRVATVFRGTASAGNPAEAKLTDTRGKTHYLLVEPDEPGAVYGEGSQVVVIRQQGSVYRVITSLKPQG